MTVFYIQDLMEGVGFGGGGNWEWGAKIVHFQKSLQFLGLKSQKANFPSMAFGEKAHLYSEFEFRKWNKCSSS